MALVEAVAARLRTQVPSRTVYEHAVPDGALPAAYLIVRGHVAAEMRERLCDSTNAAEATVNVLSVARNPDAHKAARTADAGATFARDALRDWRPLSGQWPLRFAAGSTPYRDESLAETTFLVGLEYDVRTTV